ncbi:MAG: DUF6159 family protein [Candidatus Thermoplasmatota archaeon]
MFAALSRGWSLTKTSFKVLSLDKEIIALPLLSAVAMIIAVVGLGAGAFGISMFDGTGFLTYMSIFGIYVVVYAIAIFFNAAVIEMATIRYNGGNPTIKDGLRKSWSRIGRILQWAVVAATVGLIFRILRDQARDSFIARILISFLEFGWNVATFFVVPIAIFQDVGPFDAIKGSMGAMKRTWGESLTGVATTGIVFFALGLLGIIPLLIGFLSGSAIVFFTFITIAVLYWIVLAAVNSAVDGILVAALYKYSIEGTLPQAFRDAGVDASNLAW